MDTFRQCGGKHKKQTIQADKMEPLGRNDSSKQHTLTRKLWEHRNDTLFRNSQNNVSQKRRAALLDEVDRELQIGHNGIRQKDAATICIQPETIKGWQLSSIDTWLKHVQTTRQRNHDQGLKRRFDRSEVDDKLYSKQRRKLQALTTHKFLKWQLKTHYETASQYIHSTKELTKDLQSFGWQIIE